MDYLQEYIDKIESTRLDGTTSLHMSNTDTSSSWEEHTPVKTKQERLREYLEGVSYGQASIM